MSVDVTVPQIGESITTVYIARWIKNVGESVEAGQGVVEVDSDKATMEVPAPSGGVLTEQLVGEGDEVEIGAIIGRIDESAQAAAPAKAEDAAPARSEPAASQQAAPSEPSDVRAGPAARQEAGRRQVDLSRVEGTGRHGRVTRADVERADTARAEPPVPTQAPAAEAPALVERVTMTPLRRTIARRLVEAQQTAAMLTTFNEVDMSAIMATRKQYQERFVKKYGMKLGFMSFFVKATIEALKEYPAVNAEIDGNDILYKSYYNIGVAVSAPRGLVVPVVRNADRLSFAETELAITELATKARDNKLTLDDFKDGTFTISNGGVFGSMMSTPILNPPQVGILGMHAINERPVVVNGQIEIRPMMYLALSYDHRIIDGREAVSFLKRLKECVEAPERILLEV